MECHHPFIAEDSVTFYNGSARLQALRCLNCLSHFFNLLLPDVFPRYFFMGFLISTYYMWSLGILFSIIYLRFFLRTLVGDDIIDLLCFLVCFVIIVALGLIISVMILFRVSMSSSYYSAANLFFSCS